MYPSRGRPWTTIDRLLYLSHIYAQLATVLEAWEDPHDNVELEPCALLRLSR